MGIKLLGKAYQEGSISKDTRTGVVSSCCCLHLLTLVPEKLNHE